MSSPMDSLPLLSLAPEMFTKVINKLKGKEYFLLRQTCRAVNDLINHNRAICPNLDDCFKIEYNAWGDEFDLYNRKKDFLYKEVYSGARIGELWLPDKRALWDAKPSYEEKFQELVEFIKKARITCDELVFKDLENIWSKEHCDAFIKMLKPRSITLNSDHGNRFEALFEQNKITKIVDVTVPLEQIQSAMRGFLPKFEQVTLFTESLQPISLLRNTLQQFLAQPHPNLTDFTFITMCHGVESKDGLLQEFSELSWTQSKVNTYYGDGIPYHTELSANVPLPPQFPPQFTCKLVVYWPWQHHRYDDPEVYFNIFYEVEETD